MAFTGPAEPETSSHGVGTVAESSVTQRSQPSPPIVHRADDWHPVKDISLQVNTSQIPNSASGVSSAVEDVGDSFQLQDIAERRLSGDVQSTISHTGAHLPNIDNIERPRSIPDDFDDDPSYPLQSHIRGLMLIAAGSAKLQFLPLSELDAVVTRRNIYRELKRTELTADLEDIAFQVWSPVDLPNSKTTTRRRIFATLCLMNKAEEIQTFIDEDIFDVDLPFEFEHDGRVFRRSGVLIRLFTKWQSWDRDSFENYQGRFLAPYFKFMSPKFREYDLHRCVVLPFLESVVEDGSHNDPIMTLFSVVRRVAIHSAHHDYFTPLKSSEKMHFAVKQLQTEQSQAKGPNREIAAYKRLNSIRHPHIVRLLATYSHQDKLHMIFPWADSNLYQFWEEDFPDTSFPPRNHHLARWMIKQFVGLAEALKCIHNFDVLASNDLSTQDRKQTHGRHGDIKPENILCFKNASSDSSVDKLGNLMISDLGSTEFHGTLSNIVQANAAGGFTETYKAPEFDIMKQVSPDSDIWSFGCVLFQFIVWYVLGWAGVEDFTEERKADSNFVIPSDHFFNFFKNENSVEAKASVRKEFQKLRENDRTSDFVLDLLDLVETSLLRLRASQRASCEEVVAKLSSVKDLCYCNVEYCTRRTRRDVPRTPTDLSDKVYVSLSDQMKDEYIKNIGPVLYPGSSRSTIRRSTVSVGEEDRSRTTGGGADDASNAAGASSTKLEPPGSANDLNTTAGHERPDPTEQIRPRLYKRAWIRMCKLPNSCFR